MRFEIEGVEFANDAKPVVIAEIGINHEGSLKVAKEMASAAIQAGARFIKHQTHIPFAEMSKEAERAIPGNAKESIFEIMQRCALSNQDELELMEFVNSRGGIYLSTPFSREAVDRLESMGVPAYKIGSGECNNYPLVEYVARQRKPVILSTGMNSIESIRVSVSILESHFVPYVLMHTTNLYPTPHRLLRLGALSQMRQAFPSAILGLSDHSTSNAACVASVALGARVLERHFTDSKSRVGPDIVCSMDPNELSLLLQHSEEAFLALGGEKKPSPEEQVTINFAFASVCAIKDIKAGEKITEENAFPIRPSGGDFSPADYRNLLGKVVTRDVQARTQIRKEDIQLDS